MNTTTNTPEANSKMLDFLIEVLEEIVAVNPIVTRHWDDVWDSSEVEATVTKLEYDWLQELAAHALTRTKEPQ